MKEYRRLVSYLYEYKNQQKGKNAGFVRMELRDPRCRIRVCINGSGGNTRQTGSVLLIRVRETDTEEIPLGTITVNNGSGETSFQTQADRMGGSPYPWEDFAGIRIILPEPEQNFYTYWDDRVEDMGRSGISRPQPMSVSGTSEEEMAETAAEPEDDMAGMAAAPESEMEAEEVSASVSVQKEEKFLEPEEETEPDEISVAEQSVREEEPSEPEHEIELVEPEEETEPEQMSVAEQSVRAEEPSEPEHEIELLEPESSEEPEMEVEAEEKAEEEVSAEPEEMAGEEVSAEPEEIAEEEVSAELEEMAGEEVSAEPAMEAESEEMAAEEVSAVPEMAAEPEEMAVEKVSAEPEMEAESEEMAAEEVSAEPEMEAESEEMAVEKVSDEPEMEAEPEEKAEEEISAESEEMAVEKVSDEPEIAAEPEEMAEEEVSAEPEVYPGPAFMPEESEDIGISRNDKEYIEWHIPVEERPDLDRELRMEEQMWERGYWSHSRPEPWPEEPRITWKQLSSMYPKYLPFDGEKNWEILRLSLQDIGRLPRDYWHLGTNDFVVHGFYDHRHLILVCDPQSGSYYLGVPGEALEQDRRVAELFGFRKYRPAGQFGYWLTGIKL